MGIKARLYLYSWPYIHVDNFPPAFLLCWWPYAIIFVRGTFMEGEEEKKTTGELLYNMVIPAYLNSLINPLLYIALNEDVRETLKNLILCRDMAMVIQSTRRPREIHLVPREKERKSVQALAGTDNLSVMSL